MAQGPCVPQSAGTRDEVNARPGTQAEITAETGLLLESVEAVQALPVAPASLDEAITDDGGTILSLIEDPTAADPEAEALTLHRTEVLSAAIARLPERQRNVIERRYGFGGPAVSLAELSRELHLCPQRTRAIEQAALFRLAKVLEGDPTFQTPAGKPWTLGPVGRPSAAPRRRQPGTGLRRRPRSPASVAQTAAPRSSGRRVGRP